MPPARPRLIRLHALSGSAMCLFTTLRSTPSPAFFAAICGLLFLVPGQVLGVDPDRFESRIRPMLVEKCLRCHGESRKSGGVRLDNPEGWAKGGKNGPILDSKNSTQSRVLRAARQEPGIKQMPPDEPLTARELADLTQWIKEGAAWPKAVAKVAAKDHWSFAPLREVTVPQGDPANPIDRFIDAKIASHHLDKTATATREVLLRRLAFHLIGLPPTPEEQIRFAKLTDASWFATAMEHYLASPGYGVRWGRAWLDVVRYADTAGETADFPVPQAYRYRNWVIDAFRRDLPYNEFLRYQIAGDIIAQHENADASRTESLTTATGYWAIARRFGFNVVEDHYLTIEDAIDTLGKSVLGLGLSCARCHDHKYDPISNADYYSLYGILESTKFPMPGCEKVKAPADFVRAMDRQTKDAIATTKTRLDRVSTEQNEIGKIWTERLNQAKPLASVTLSNNGSGSFPEGLTAVANAGDFVLLEVLPNANHGGDSTLVQFSIGTRVHGKSAVHDVVKDFLTLAQSSGPTHLGHWMALDLGGGTARSMTNFVPNGFNTQGVMVWRGSAELPCAFVNIREQPNPFQTVKPPAQSLALHPGPTGAVALAFEVQESGPLSIKGHFQKIDAGGDGVTARVRILPGARALLERIKQKTSEAESLRTSLDTLAQSKPLLYAVTEGTPHDAQLHKRGNPQDRGDPVKRHNLTLLGGQPLNQAAQSGRLELAGWLTDPKNPLTTRVLVNRIWQGHFGEGLSRTPNDFGLRGDPPSHPELLDWLARDFQAGGWSIKNLHRKILTSQAWQRSSHATAAGIDADPDNRWLARFPRLRLSAEELRDSMLAVSGELDAADAQGHPFPAENAWGFTQHGPFRANYETNKRSVFLMVQRIQRHPFLGLFDGADPNSSTASRQVTTVPPQALWFMNNPFVEARAQKLVDLLPAEPTAARIDRLCHLLFGRAATSDDRADAEELLANRSGTDLRQGWVILTRTLLASNEFTHRD